VSWRCIKDDPAGREIPTKGWSLKPVCPWHGDKACVVNRLVHHVEGCKQSKDLVRSSWGRRGALYVHGPPKPYCVTEVERVTCHNCQSKLRRLGLLEGGN